MLEEALFRAIVPSAGQTRKIEQYRDLGARFVCLRGKIEVQGHVAVCAGSLVLELQQLAPKGGNRGSGFERHDGGCNYQREEEMKVRDEDTCTMM